MKKKIDVAETLVEAADAIGTDLVFDEDGNLVSGTLDDLEDVDDDDDEADDDY